MNYSTEVKQKLLSIITKMDSYYWLFTKHPKTDFSRKKKWSFEEVMKFMLTMEGKALRDELLEYFEFDNTTPSNSSFNQRRAQILPEAFEFLFQEFTKSFTDNVTYNGLTDIRFKILNVDTLAVMYDSAKDDDTHKTSFTGSGGWCCAEKARLTTVVGTEYYLVVYCTNPTEGVSLRTGSIATAVGNPVMCAASTKIIPGTSVTATGSGYSSTRTFSVSGDDIPNTAQVRTISLSGTGMSKIKRWRLMAPNKSVWVANESDFYPSINFNFVNDSSSNAKLKGTWSVAFQSSSSSYTFIPSYSVSYYYEYGD